MGELTESSRAGRVIWITGLSGAGKSTLASALAKRLREHDSATLLLDGDEMREIFHLKSADKAGYDRGKRIELGLKYGRLCNIFAMQGFTVVIATISLFREVHKWNRAHLPGYFEVYLKVPMKELRRRDSKGIYQRYDSGDLKNVAGLDLAIDEPESSNWVSEFSPEKSASQVLDELVGQLTIDNK